LLELPEFLEDAFPLEALLVEDEPLEGALLVALLLVDDELLVGAVLFVLLLVDDEFLVDVFLPVFASPEVLFIIEENLLLDAVIDDFPFLDTDDLSLVAFTLLLETVAEPLVFILSLV
jgi:hypothetical protein